MQCNTNGAITHYLDRAIGHANLCLDDLKAVLAKLFRDVSIGHRTKQATINTGLLRQFDDRTGELFSYGLRFGQLGSGGGN